MTSDETLEQRDVFVVLDRLERDHAGGALALERSMVVEHERDATTHSGGEVAPRLPEDDYDASGHVLAPVITDAFNDRDRATVPHGKPLAGHTVQVRFAARCAVESDVPHEDGVRRIE